MNRLTNFPKILLAIVLGVSLGALSIAYAQTPFGTIQGGNSDNDACSSSAAETKLKKRETALLGPDHAEAHAKARAHKCKVAKGQEKLAKPDPQMLAAP